MKTTSITARLNYRADSEGCHALIIQVIHRRRRSILTTPYRLRPEEFDAQRGRAVAVNRTKSRRTLIREANECVALCTEELRAVCARLAASGKPYTASDITGAYRSGNDNRYVEAFAKQLASDLEEAGRFGTARSYRSLASAWSKFAAQSRYRFSQLDEHTVFAFGEYLKRRGNRRNTVSFYLRTLHALYNRARRCGYAPTHRNPFREVSFKPARTPKLAVPRSLLRTLAGRDFGESELNEARDMFLFSFYARGMSFVDMCYDPGSPWVLPCMQRGMLSSANKQEDMNGDVPPASLYNFYCMALHYYLILLKEISRRLGCRNLTFNVARHTWATEARSMGVPTPHISEGLGHTSERTTRIYLASLDRQTVDEVNERVTKL